MSHQNVDDKSTTEPETPPKTDRELATALRAMALATQDPSPIFELNVDCWEEIFDWLSLYDLHSFGQTCKFFHRITGKYFEWKYRRFVVRVDNDKMSDFCKDSQFSEFAQRLSLFESESDPSLLYASASYMSPKELEIGFMNIRSTDLDINRLERMLASVEVLEFAHTCVWTDEFIDSILKLCANNLRRLSMQKRTRPDWMHLKYPKLQHLEHLHASYSAQDIVQFFEANPNVRSFTTGVHKILDYRQELMASNIELDDLVVEGDTRIDGIPNAFNDLYNRGFYKRLHFTIYISSSFYHLTDLPGLTALHFYADDYIDLPLLPTVTRMSFQPLWGGRNCDLDMEEVTNALPNLECVSMYGKTHMGFIMPFIRNSKRLNEIKTQYFRKYHYGDIDPVLMNSEREKLNGAHKVTIYVQEKDYLKIKWKYNKSDFGIIQLKRRESYDGMLDMLYNFD